MGFFRKNTTKKVTTLKNKYHNSWLGKQTRVLTDEEVLEILNKDSGKNAKNKKINYSTGGIALLIVSGLCFYGAGWIGQNVYLGNMKEYIGEQSTSQSGNLTEQDKKDIEKIKVEADPQGTKNPNATKYILTPSSRDVTEYLVEKYNLPEGYNFTVKQDNGADMVVEAPYSKKDFQIIKGTSGIEKDNFLSTVYSVDGVQVGEEWKNWIKQTYGVDVEIVWSDQTWKGYWVEKALKGDDTSSLFRENPQNFTLNIKGVITNEKQMLEVLFKYAKGERNGYPSGFSVEVKNSKGTNLYSVNKHGEIVNK